MSVTGPSPVSNNPFVQQLSQKMGDFGSDGRITKDEAKDLKAWIANSGLSAEEQAEMSEMVDALKKATNNSFLGLFSWKSDISLSEMHGLQALAEKNGLASQLLENFANAAQTFPMQDSSSFTNRLSSLFTPDQVRFKPGQQADYIPENAPTINGTNYSVPADGVTPSGQRTATGDVRNQYFNPDGSRSATGAGDCGPTSALMILDERGYPASVSKTSELRALLSSDRQGAVATSRDDLMTIMNHYSGGKIRRAAEDAPFQSGEASKLIAHAKAELAKGNSVIMLNGSFGGSAGHYTVIKGVNDDGTLQVADPATGTMRTITPQQLEFAMANRSEAGRGSAYLMSLTG